MMPLKSPQREVFDMSKTTTRLKYLSLISCILISQLGCTSKNLTAEDVIILPVWKDQNTPAPIPSSCVNIGSAHGSGKTDEEALRNFKLDVLKKGGNAATLLSGTKNINAVTHAGLVYKCDREQP
jgi:hypothetical protein